MFLDDDSCWWKFFEWHHYRLCSFAEFPVMFFQMFQQTFQTDTRYFSNNSISDPVIDLVIPTPERYWSWFKLIAANFLPMVKKDYFQLYHSCNGIMEQLSPVLYSDQSSAKLLCRNPSMYSDNNIKVSLSFERAMIYFALLLIAQSVCMITLSSVSTSQLLRSLMVLICFPSSSIAMLPSIKLSIIWTATFLVYNCSVFLKLF